MGDARLLMARMDAQVTACLAQATEDAVACGHGEVTVEHLATALVRHLKCDDAGSFDVFSWANVCGTTLEQDLELAVGATAQSAARPVLAPRLLQWLKAAWLDVSLRTAWHQVNPCGLLMVLGCRAQQLTACQTPAWSRLANLSLQALAEAMGASEAGRDASSQQGMGRAAHAHLRSTANDEALATLTVSLTDAARNGALDPIVGRDIEIRQLIDILSRRRKNNPVVVGEPGVGKTALVEGLAQEIVAKSVPQSLWQADVRTLDVGLLQAGASMKGELEKRLKAIIDAVQNSPTPIILFVDEAHLLIGGGQNAGGVDVANILKPALARGSLRTIAATTWAEYKKYFDQDPALARRFQPVHVAPPTQEVAINMLRALVPRYMAAHGLTIRDSAVTAAVTLSERYVGGRHLPDKAIDLLDTAAARLRVSHRAPWPKLTALREQSAAVERQLEGLRREAQLDGSSPEGGARPELLATHEGLLQEVARHERAWLLERDAVAALLAARAACAEPGAEVSAKQKLAQAQAVLDALPLRYLSSEIDAAMVSEVVQGWTGVPVDHMASGPIEAALQLEQRLSAAIVGQPLAVKAVAQSVRTAVAGLHPPEQPRGVLLFLGPSGVGKTETALTLARHLYGDPQALTVINMSEFGQKHMVSQLIGAPPGYAGYGTGGRLTEAVRKRPYSLVLLDECEKADPEVMNLFYQVFDKGSLTDGEGREVDFRHTLIILTSNVGTAELMLWAQRNRDDDAGAPHRGTAQEATQQALLEHFAPALLGRMTCIPYLPLAADALRYVAILKLQGLEQRLRSAHHVSFTWSAAVPDRLAQTALKSPHSGARAIGTAITQELLPKLTYELLSRKITNDTQAALSPVSLSLDVTDDTWSMTWRD